MLFSLQENELVVIDVFLKVIANLVNYVIHTKLNKVFIFPAIQKVKKTYLVKKGQINALKKQ